MGSSGYVDQQVLADYCTLATFYSLASSFLERIPKGTMKNVIASIGYQIALNAPVFQCSIEAQLITLIINPLTQLSNTGTFQSNPISNLINRWS